MSGFNYENLVEFERDLERAAEALSRGEIKEILINAMKPIEEAAIINAPYKTGTLKGTIKTYVLVKSGGVFKATTGNHRKDWPEGKVYYPPFVAYGHAGPHGSGKRTPPHPYLRPAFDSHKEEALRRLGEGLSETLKKNGL
jgi:HK97 gp10 family phage protein